MSIITNKVNIAKRYWESPLNEKRVYMPHRWKGSIATDEAEYINDVPVVYYAKHVLSQPPSLDCIYSLAHDDGYDAKFYYACDFQMSDFDLHGKVSTDLGSNETGKEYYIDKDEALYYALKKNPMECEEDVLFIERLSDKTFHLNDGYSLLAELQEREYTGKVWAIVADYSDN